MKTPDPYYLPWRVTIGALYCGLARSREEAISLAEEAGAGLRWAARGRIHNTLTEEQWSGALGDWRREALPQRIETGVPGSVRA